MGLADSFHFLFLPLYTKRERIMYFLAPLILAAAFSAALYKTQEVWNKDLYEARVNPTAQVKADVAELQQRVQAGQISSAQANVAMGLKYGTA